MKDTVISHLRIWELGHRVVHPCSVDSPKWGAGIFVAGNGGARGFGKGRTEGY